MVEGAPLLLAPLGGAALEALHATAGIDQLLTPGVEGMAFRADLDVELGLRRARGELVPQVQRTWASTYSGWIPGFIGLSKFRESSKRDQPGRQHQDRQRGQEDQD